MIPKPLVDEVERQKGFQQWQENEIPNTKCKGFLSKRSELSK